MTIAWTDLDAEEKAAAARISPAHLSKLLHPDRIIPKHVAYMSRVIADTVERGHRTRDGEIIIVMMPPGHIKSDTCSVHTPLWFLERWPDRNVALASYGHEKAAEWGRLVRNQIQENPDKFVVRLTADSKAAHRWNTNEGGGMLCTGIGGPLTGFRAHILIVDDPVKDDEEAQSETMRAKSWDWFTSVAVTRCWPEATILVVMTRWHEDDLVGRLLDMEKTAADQGLALKRITVVRFPCIAEEDDVLGRSVGDPLWPGGGYNAEWAAQTRTLEGSHKWASLYQQRPAPAGGGMFRREHFHYYKKEPDHYVLGNRRHLVNRCWIGQTCDTAMTDRDSSDWTVMLTFAVTPDADLVILDVARVRLEVPEQWGFIMDQRDRFRRRGQYRWTGVENRSSGIGLLQLAKKHGIPLKELDAVTDKVTRASTASVFYENGKVWHPADAPWLDVYEHELLTFPNGKHDDQVDTIAHAARNIHLRVREIGKPEPHYIPDPLRDYAPAGAGLEDW